LPCVLEGVDWLVILPDLVVHVRAGGTAGAAGVPNLVAASDTLSRFNGDLGEVPVTAGDAVTVIDNNKISIPGIGSGPDYQAVCSG